MIFIHDKIYAKVWKVEKHDKYIDLQVTTSEKGNEGKYVNSGWFPRLIGHAFNSLKDKIKEGDSLVITKSKMTNERYTKDGVTKSTFKFIVLEAEIAEPRSEATVSAQITTAEQTAAESAANDACPW